jgi:hypothetical protein
MIPRVTTLGDAFAATVSANPEAPALESAGGAMRWTWREYSDRVAAVVLRIASVGGITNRIEVVTAGLGG